MSCLNLRRNCVVSVYQVNVLFVPVFESESFSFSQTELLRGEVLLIWMESEMTPESRAQLAQSDPSALCCDKSSSSEDTW